MLIKELNAEELQSSLAELRRFHQHELTLHCTG